MNRDYRPQPIRLSPKAPPRKKRGNSFFKGSLVVLGAIMLTTLAIRASDSFVPPNAALLAGVGNVVHCPDDMVYVPTSSGGFCVDRFEESAGASCHYQESIDPLKTDANMTDPTCVPVSVKGKEPWVNLTLSQAMELCARAGKRLPVNSEWYRSALGTPDDVSGGSPHCALGRIGATFAEKTGAHGECVSSSGAYDMIGNVWEWVDANVVAGVYGGRMLPDEGYAVEADADGVAVHTATTSSSLLHDDYFFVDKNEVRGMFRGGFWNMSEKAGIYSINATIPTSFVGVAVGFRCVK